MNTKLLCGLDLNEAKHYLKNEKYKGEYRVVGPKEVITLEAYDGITLFVNDKGYVVEAG